MKAFFERFFNFKEYNTDLRTETIAGMTTFLTMVYIFIVNPVLLSSAGIPINQVFTATVISAVVGTLYMALFAKYPIAIAPGMGMNVYFTTVVLSKGLSYQTVLGAVFIAGILFLLLSLTKLRETLINSIPNNLKYAITSGIGFFIAFIGLRMSGLVVSDPVTLITFGDLHKPVTALTLAGLLITITLMLKKVPGSLFIGMVVTAIIGYFLGLLRFNGIVALPPAPVFFDLDIAGVFTHNLYPVVFSFLLVTIFDTTGTMIGIAEQAGLFKNGKFPRAQSALMADAVATTTGAMFGTSPTSAYIESSAGVAAGGRTGMTSLVVSILIMLSLFFVPLVTAIASLTAITAPILIIVGTLMCEGMCYINWRDFEEAFPALAIMLTMPFTSSIATGLAVGFITYPIMKLITKKGKEVHPILYVFGVIFAIQMIFFPAR